MSTLSKPDTAFEMCHLSTKLNATSMKDVKRANKIVKKIKQDDEIFSDNYTVMHLHIVGSLPVGASQGRIITFLSDRHEVFLL